MFGSVASVLLIVCAAGGLQRLCQLTGMAEMLGERALAWHLGAFGVLIPFLAAAVIKTLQGSSSVAAITAAGMVQPLLSAIGLADANGTALAALAIGAGAMTVSHVNDEYFWLVTESTGFSAVARDCRDQPWHPAAGRHCGGGAAPAFSVAPARLNHGFCQAACVNE